MRTKEDVFLFLKKHPKPYCKEEYFKKKFLEHYNELLKYNFPDNFKFQ